MPYQTIAEKENKAKVIGEFKTSPTDTGSSEVQIASLTERISHITDHLRKNKKDFTTQRGLLKLVGKRRRLLNYLKAAGEQRYEALIGKLNLRK